MLLVDILGKGGYGKVYLAFDLSVPEQRQVAVKLMTLEPLPEHLERFEREAVTLSRLNHRNIIGFLRNGLHDGYPYIAMEYVDNAITLKEEILRRLEQGQRFSTEEIRRILFQVLDALESSHALQIIHRDIKPDNLMLQQRSDGEQVVRVLDFGLAKFVEEGTRTLALTGTPTYMAPEQLLKRHIGPWTDLFAVGAIAFELISGLRPYTGDSIAEVFQKKNDPNFDPTLRLKDLNLPLKIRFFLKKALAWSTEQRFQSCAAFRTALEDSLLVLEPQPAEQPSVLTTVHGETDSQRLVEEATRLQHEKRGLEAERQRYTEESREWGALREKLREITVADVQGQQELSQLLGSALVERLAAGPESGAEAGPALVSSPVETTLLVPDQPHLETSRRNGWVWGAVVAVIVVVSCGIVLVLRDRDKQTQQISTSERKTTTDAGVPTPTPNDVTPPSPTLTVAPTRLNRVSERDASRGAVMPRQPSIPAPVATSKYSEQTIAAMLKEKSVCRRVCKRYEIAMRTLYTPERAQEIGLKCTQQCEGQRKRSVKEAMAKLRSLLLVSDMMLGKLDGLPDQQRRYCEYLCPTIRDCYRKKSPLATAQRMYISCNIVCGMYHQKKQMAQYLLGARAICGHVGVTLRDPR